MFKMFALKVAFILLIFKINENICLAAREDGLYRLPNDTKPILYDLRIVPYLNEGHFTGTLGIRIRVEKPTPKVHLHNQDLHIIRAIVSDEHSKLNASINLLPDDDIMILSLAKPLLANHEYTLNISYKGNLNHHVDGFFNSSYIIGNTTKQMAATLLDPTSARKVFPCYDEPRFKAAFRLAMARYPHQSVVGNMPLKSTSLPDPLIGNRVWDTFETSPPMATYLVAFIISEFKNLTNPAGTFSVRLREDAVDHSHYMLMEGQILLKQMEEYTGIKYSLPKMDFIGIPDFLDGAMEHWGLITFSEKALMCEPGDCATRDVVSALRLAAHEISQQWFGNYITPIWWDYLWLSEGFAQYFEYHLVAQIEPTWRMDDWYVPDIVQAALLNGEVDDHPITNKVKNHSDILASFDAITYHKAGSLLRMFEHIVTKKTFKEVLNVFLDQGHHKHNGSVEPEHLWQAFTSATTSASLHIPSSWTLRDIMQLWATNRGHPLVKVTRRPSNGKMVNVTLSEEKYHEPEEGHHNDNQSWVIPVSCTRRSSINFNKTQPSFWILPGRQTVLKNVVEQDEWILCNIQQTGYYRVHYDDQNWELLIQQLYTDHKKIHYLNRAQLIDDACVLAQFRKIHFRTLFKLLRYLEHETDPVVLSSAITCLQYMHHTYNRFLKSPILKNFTVEIITPHLNRIGFEVGPSQEDMSIRYFRPSLIYFACLLDIEACVTAAKKEYEKNKLDLRRIERDVKDTVLCTLLRTSKKEVLEAVEEGVWAIYNTSEVTWEMEAAAKALSCLEDPRILKRYLHTLVFATEREYQHHSDLFNIVFSSPSAIHAGYEFIQDILPSYKTLTEEQHKMFMHLATHCVLEADTENRQKLVHNIIETIEDLDQEIYGDLHKDLISALEMASEHTASYTAGAEEIGEALKDRPAPIKPTPIPVPVAPSKCSDISDSTVILGIIICTTIISYCL